jgi:hypothetical protein
MTNIDDVELYLWKWDPDAVIEGFGRFKEKWGLDMVTKSEMREHMVRLTNKVGFFTKLRPKSRLSLALDGFYYDTRRSGRRLAGAVSSFKDRLKFGADA